MLQMADAALKAIDDDLAAWTMREPFAGPVARLAAYRGIQVLGATRYEHGGGLGRHQG